MWGGGKDGAGQKSSSYCCVLYRVVKCIAYDHVLLQYLMAKRLSVNNIIYDVSHVKDSLSSPRKNRLGSRIQKVLPFVILRQTRLNRKKQTKGKGRKRKLKCGDR